MRIEQRHAHAYLPLGRSRLILYAYQVARHPHKGHCEHGGRLPFTTPILRVLSSRSSGSRLFCFGARFTPIRSAVSFHEFWLGGKGNLSGKALEPCLDAYAAARLYLAERYNSTVAGVRSDGPGRSVTKA